MANYPTLAVLIRSHNAIGRIDSCIASVHSKQILQPDKIYVCDDCSTDGTWAFLQSQYGNDKHFVLLRNDSNHGPGYTMRRRSHLDLF